MRTHGRIPRVVVAQAGVVPKSALPPGPAALALRAGGKAARPPDVASPLGRREDLCLVGLVAVVQQGLREAARDRGSDDLRCCDEPADATPTGAGGVKRFRLDDSRRLVCKTPSRVGLLGNSKRTVS